MMKVLAGSHNRCSNANNGETAYAPRPAVPLVNVAGIPSELRTANRRLFFVSGGDG